MGRAPASALTVADEAAQVGPAVVRGYSIRGESVVNIRNGTSDTDPIIATCAIAASGPSQTVELNVAAPAGVWVEVVSGSPVGVVYIG